MNLVTSAANFVLGLFLPALDAGACVPEHGDFCFCRKHKEWVVGCLGPCINTHDHC